MPLFPETIALALASLASGVPGTPPAAALDPIPIREVLAIDRLGRRGRSPVGTDALLDRLAAGEWSPPEEGETVRSTAGDERSWTRVEAGDDGWLSGSAFSGGWAWTTVDVPTAGPWRLDAAGHAFVLVDGVPRGGDVYALGLTRLPLALEAGPHELLFACGRGRLRATLEPAPAALFLEDKDPTLPDVVRGEDEDLWLGVLVSNAGTTNATDLAVVAEAAGGATRTALPPLPRESQRKCAVRLEPPEVGDAGALPVRLSLVDGSGATRHELELELAVRGPHEKHARTFRSAIDGSVQEYAVTPPPGPGDGERAPALFLSLHGAGVGARNQAFAYAPKEDGFVVAPTNRRPFGFDWEDWGRLDALEVLELAAARFGTDPRRTYLTGHSMGGHGVWQIGSHFPDRFAAIAPSAGWRDFWSYGGGSELPADDPVGALLARAANPSRTALLRPNLASLGIYVLHGDADDNVPVSEARAMREALGAFHANFAYYERPGAGHWWGNACMDWPPLFAFLRQNERPEPRDVLSVDFTTVDPGVSSRCDWVAIEGQERFLEPARLRASLEPDARTIRVELENVARFALDLAAFVRADGERPPVIAPDHGVLVRVGDDEVDLPREALARPAVFRRGADGWTAGPPLSPWYKGPHRSGRFKDAFRHRMVLVYGTAGSPEEDAWAHAKARYDHETWRYRGNGAVDVVADVDFRPSDDPDRGVILYGNRDTNAAWTAVLGDTSESGAFDLRRGGLRVGEHELAGDDLALLVVYPRRGSDVACVAVVGGTGLAGARATDHLPYFVSGVGYPDWTVLGAEHWRRGLAAIRSAGFFRDDWSPLGADEAWR